MKEIIIGLASIAFLALVFYVKPNVVNPMDIEMSDTPKNSHKSTEVSISTPSIDKKKGIHLKHPDNQLSNNATETFNPLNHMSAEMKQTLRDQLLLHGTGETFTKDDGTVVLPSQGRATQVSVGIMMPDGSVQIREYSEIPDEQAPLYQMSKPTK